MPAHPAAPNRVPERPPVAFDHVQVAVASLEEATPRFELEHGLQPLPGGVHPGRGTANTIVPLGSSYIELIAVVDPTEGAGHPQSRRVVRAVESGRTFAVWVARTDDLDAARSYLEARGFRLPPAEAGQRRRPDGVTLRWRTQELVGDGELSPLPFLIEWQVDPASHPGAGAGAARVAPTVRLVLSHPDPKEAEARLREVVGTDVEYAVEPGPPGVSALILKTPGGEVTIL